MVKLIFTIRNQLFMILIKDMKVYYTDKNVKIPEEFIPETAEERKEYDLCKTEDELASFAIRDCIRQGAVLIRRDE